MDHQRGKAVGIPDYRQGSATAAASNGVVNGYANRKAFEEQQQLQQMQYEQMQYMQQQQQQQQRLGQQGYQQRNAPAANNVYGQQQQQNYTSNEEHDEDIDEDRLKQTRTRSQQLQQEEYFRNVMQQQQQQQQQQQHFRGPPSQEEVGSIGEDEFEAVASEKDEEEQDLHDNNQEEGEEEGEELEELEEEEEDESSSEPMICVKCEQPADKALILQCHHQLCLDCASLQFKQMCQIVTQHSPNPVLPSSIDCELCKISTPLAVDSVTALLEMPYPGGDSNSHEDNQQQQQQKHDEQQQGGSWQLNDSFNVHQHQQQILYQQQQQQQQLLQQKQYAFHQQQQQQQQSQSQSQRESRGSRHSYGSQRGSGHFHNPSTDHNQSPPPPQELGNGFVTLGRATNQLDQAGIAKEESQYHANIEASKFNRKADRAAAAAAATGATSHNSSYNRPNHASGSTDEAILFCFSCESPCFTLEEYLRGMHKNHIVKNVCKAYTDLQQPLEKLREELKSKATLLSQDEVRLQKKREELENVLNECRVSISQSIEDVIRAAKLKEGELIRAAEEAMEEKFAELDKAAEKVSGSIENLADFDHRLQTAYYGEEDQQTTEQANDVASASKEINAFNVFVEMKPKIIERLRLIDTNVFQQVNEKLSYEFALDTNSFANHLNSIQEVHVQVSRLQGLSSSATMATTTRVKQEFLKPSDDKPKKLLEQIISQHAANSTDDDDQLASNRLLTAGGGRRLTTSTNLHGNQQQHQQLPSVTAPYQNAENLSGFLTSNVPARQLLTNYISQEITQSHNTGGSLDNVSLVQSTYHNALQMSPHNYVKGSNNFPQGEQTRRYLSPNRSQQLSSSVAMQRQRTPPHAVLNSKQTMNHSQSFKTFSISSPSSKQEFSNILTSPSSIVKKYTNVAGGSGFGHTSNGSTITASSAALPQHRAQTSSIISKPPVKINILEQLESFKKSIDEIRRNQGALPSSASPNDSFSYLPSNGNGGTSSEQQVNLAVQNRMKLLQGKLVNKLC